MFHCLRTCKNSWNHQFFNKERHCRDARNKRKTSICPRRNGKIVIFQQRTITNHQKIHDFLYADPPALEKKNNVEIWMPWLGIGFLFVDKHFQSASYIFETALQWVLIWSAGSRKDRCWVHQGAQTLLIDIWVRAARFVKPFARLPGLCSRVQPNKKTSKRLRSLPHLFPGPCPKIITIIVVAGLY